MKTLEAKLNNEPNKFLMFTLPGYITYQLLKAPEDQYTKLEKPGCHISAAALDVLKAAAYVGFYLLTK